MRTRWDEVDEIDSGSHRFIGFSAMTWAMAVPVAFIVGAAVMSFFGQSHLEPASLAIPAPAGGDAVKSAAVGRPVAENGRWEEEARLAAAKAAELQMQVEALRDQVGDETRRRTQAEQAAAQNASALEKMQAQASARERPATAITVSNPAMQPQEALSFAAPTGSEPSAFGARVESEPQQQSVSTGGGSTHTTGRANDDSIALQRIIEDTASRSAALADRRDEVEGDTGPSSLSARSASASRSVAAVDAALEKATGLEGLSASQRTGLRDELAGGACVTVSLEKVLGNPVPVVPLRNLVRDLDSDC